MKNPIDDPTAPPIPSIATKRHSRAVVLITAAGILCEAHAVKHISAALREIFKSLLPVASPESLRTLLQQATEHDMEFVMRVMCRMPGMPLAGDWKTCAKSAMDDALVLLESGGGWAKEVEALKGVRSRFE